MTQRYEVSGEVWAGGRGALTAQRRVIEFDGSAAMGEELPGPAHLMASALAACLLKNVERFSALLSFTYERASVSIVLEREDSPPRIIGGTYRLEIYTQADDSKLRLLYKNINKFGTITNTLAASMPLRAELWVTRDDGMSALVASGGVDGRV